MFGMDLNNNYANKCVEWGDSGFIYVVFICVAWGCWNPEVGMEFWNF